jgi:hydroxymethylpyrimidine/phosphomethylpyrimidine kinase
MLYSEAVVRAVCAALEPARLPLVVDPVMVATSGAPLLEPGAVAACRERLFPLAALVTPNLAEAAVLWGAPVTDLAAMRRAGRDLCARHGCAFLLKGGHLEGEAADLLATPDGREELFRAARVPGVSTHGTGCTLSAAITAGLAAGKPLAEAVACAKAYVTRAIAGSHRWETVSGETQALDHRAG